MFNPSAKDLMEEIRESERVRDDHLRGVNRIIREYAGRWYRESRDWWKLTEGADDDDVNPEPFAYSFVSNMLPSLIAANPAAIVSARRIIGHQMVKDAIQSGLKGWINDVNFKIELERVVEDFLFFRGILLHHIEDDTRWSAGAVRPNVRRIDYRMAGGDSLASSVHEAEFLFHKFYVSLDELMGDPDALPEAVQQLSAYTGGDQDTQTPSSPPYRKGEESTLRRNRVCLYSVWLRRANVIRIIAKEKEALEVYAEREYYGPESGPYQMFDAYPVPGQFYPLSPLVAVQDQVLDLQVHARSTSRAAAGRKSVVLVDGAVANLAEDIKHAGDREVIAVNGFNGSQVQTVELGGVSPHQYEYLKFLRDRLDRHAGMTETMRGNVGGADSATEAHIANEALSARTEYLKGKVLEATAQSLKKIGWFMFHTTGIIIPVNQRDPTTGMETEGLFFGGPVPGMDTGAWEDYSIKIEPYSMQRVSEQTLQRRAMDWATFIMQVSPQMPMIPWVRWMELIRSVGQSMNQEDADKLLIPEMLGMMTQQYLTPYSSVVGDTGRQPPQHFSTPGEGFKKRQAEDNNNAPGLGGRREEFGEMFGPMGGGEQGPPGSAQPYGMPA